MSVFVKQTATPCVFTSSESWVILSPIEQSIKRKIEAVGTPLKDWGVNIYRGILTGCNEAFIIDENKRTEILAQCADAAERERTEQIIRPILRGRDIKRYGYNWAGLYLIATHNGYGRTPRIDIKDYPAVKKWLDEGGIAYNRKLYRGYPQLVARADQGDTPYNLRNCAYMDDFAKPKIVWMDLSDVPTFAYDKNSQFTNNTVYFMSGEENLLYLLGYLNSKIATYLFSQIGSTSGGGTTRWQAFTMERLFVPRATKEKQSRMAGLVERLLATKSADTEVNTSVFESQIDAQVYRLYGLTSEEIAVVEGCK